MSPVAVKTILDHVPPALTDPTEPAAVDQLGPSEINNKAVPLVPAPPSLLITLTK